MKSKFFIAFSFIAEMLSRLTIGIVFFESGLGKLKNLPKVISYFESLNIPFANIQAPFVSIVELVGGFLVFFGIFVPYASLPLIAVMGVAILTAKIDDIEMFSDVFSLSEFLFIVVLCWLVVNGSKWLSVDSYLRKKEYKIRNG